MFGPDFDNTKELRRSMGMDVSPDHGSRAGSIDSDGAALDAIIADRERELDNMIQERERMSIRKDSSFRRDPSFRRDSAASQKLPPPSKDKAKSGKGKKGRVEDRAPPGMPRIKEWVPHPPDLRPIDSWRQWAKELQGAFDAPLESVTNDSPLWQIYRTKKPNPAPDDPAIDEEEDKKWVPKPPPCGYGNGYPIYKDGRVDLTHPLPKSPPPVRFKFEDPGSAVPKMWPKGPGERPRRRREPGEEKLPRQTYSSGMIQRPISPGVRPSRSIKTYL